METSRETCNCFLVLLNTFMFYGSPVKLLQGEAIKIYKNVEAHYDSVCLKSLGKHFVCANPYFHLFFFLLVSCPFFKRGQIQKLLAHLQIHSCRDDVKVINAQIITLKTTKVFMKAFHQGSIMTHCVG